METAAHNALKVEAVRWMVRSGCCAAAVEVRCPIARHRVDAAGYIDPLPRAAARAFQTPPLGSEPLSRGQRAKSVIIECKQSRSDFLTDSRDVDELLAERTRVLRVRRTLEEQIVKVCEPQLRVSGSRLFPELEEWEFGRSRVASYRGVLADLRRIDEQLHGESKFWMLAHYRLADWLYLAAPAGVIRTREIPPGWGLLEMPKGWEPGADNGSSLGLSVRVGATEQSGKPDHRHRLLRNIAVAATRRAVEGSGQPSGAIIQPLGTG